MFAREIKLAIEILKSIDRNLKRIADSLEKMNKDD